MSKPVKYVVLQMENRRGAANPQESITDKEAKAMFVKMLVDLDVPYRKIMDYMGYKSPHSISALLESLDV